jgi:hypothetical protein
MLYKRLYKPLFSIFQGQRYKFFAYIHTVRKIEIEKVLIVVVSLKKQLSWRSYLKQWKNEAR